MRKEKFGVSRVLRLLVLTLWVLAVSGASYFLGYYIRALAPIGVVDFLAGLGLGFSVFLGLVIAGVFVFIAGFEKGRSL